VLGTGLIPFCVVGRDSGDPMAEEDADEAGGDGRALSGNESRGAETLAMMSFGGAARDNELEKTPCRRCGLSPSY
jgi:hypothetical protein